ncbi:hypothetical protein AB8879_10500 [Alphaproteobacteria bacterium LSUCC0744]
MDMVEIAGPDLNPQALKFSQKMSTDHHVYIIFGTPTSRNSGANFTDKLSLSPHKRKVNPVWLVLRGRTNTHFREPFGVYVYLWFDVWCGELLRSAFPKIFPAMARDLDVFIAGANWQKKALALVPFIERKNHQKSTLRNRCQSYRF